MSCILLPPTHIAALVRFIADPNQPARRGNYGIAHSYRAEDGAWIKIDENTAENVAAILAQANANAYAERYGEATQPVTVTAQAIRHARTLSPAGALKACHGYAYQSSDWSGYHGSIAADIIARIERAAAQIVPGYSEADTWVIGDEPRKPSAIAS